MTSLQGTEAIIQQFAPVQGGYGMAVRVASWHAVSDWYAELILPEGATVQAGPNTTVDKRPISYKLVPADPSITPKPGGPGQGAVYLAVGGTVNAPTHVRVFAKADDGSGYAPIAHVYVTGRKGKLIEATEDAWAGSTQIETDPHKWSTEDAHGGGFGGGGGGGGGGQVELIVEVDDRGQLRKIHHKTDCGGGGGAGGGGGFGKGGKSFAEAGQQQGQTEQNSQQQHASGNPLTTLEKTVHALVERVERLEKK